MDIYDFAKQLKPNNIMVLNKTAQTDDSMFSDLLIDIYNKKPSEIWCLSQLCYDSVKYNNKILITQDEYLQKLQQKYNKRPKYIIGVTGSYGKSSTCFFLYDILKQLNYSVCMAGSIGIINHNQTIETSNISGLTTMGTAGLYKFLHENDICDFAILEISSISAKQDRIHCIKFDGGIFTALAEDHLDMHPSFDDYFQSKMKFINNVNGPKIIFHNIPIDSSEYYKFPSNNYYINNFGFSINNKNISLQSIVPQFQMNNILSALTLLDKMNINLSYLNKLNLNNIPGRMEYIGQTINGGNVYIDGAHAADQVDHMLQSIDANYQNTIIIYGASGKRLITDLRTSEILEKFDHVIITDDTPYPNDPYYIRQQLMKPHFLNIGNRIEAIQKGISITSKNKNLLILGKSTETSNSIDYDHYTIFYNEKTIVKQLLLMEKII